MTTLERECLESLAFLEQEFRHDDIHEAKDTCQWILENPTYRAWIESPRGFLWVKGNPGAGKSVLMKHAVRIAHESQSNDLISSYFIHGQGTELQRTPLGIYRALLSSMLERFPKHLARMAVTFEARQKQLGGYTAGRWKWTEKELRKFLSDLLKDGIQSQPVIIFIDAIDECGKEPARELLEYFRDLAKQVEHGAAQVKICVSSRHYPILGLDTSAAVVLEEQNHYDILQYTQERLKGISPMYKRQEMEREIISKAQGGFQWVSLVTKSIISKNLEGIMADKLLEDLKSCPATLVNLYSTILDVKDEREKHEMIKLFRWVLFAGRPLSAQELREAVATDTDMHCSSIFTMRTHENWPEDLKTFERRVKTVSRGLLRFQQRDMWEKYDLEDEDQDQEVQLIHQSVADYLMEHLLNYDAHDQRVLRSPTGAGHFQISRSCLRYLTLTEVLEGAQLQRGILSSKFPLVPYAIRHLFEHIQEVELEGIEQTDLLTIIDWSLNSRRLKQLEDLLRVLDPDSAHTPRGFPFVGATLLHCLAALGSTSAFEKVLGESGQDIYAEDSDLNTPLLIAIREGHQDIALALINRSIQLQQQYEEESAHDVIEEECRRARPKPPTNFNTENAQGDTALTVALDKKADKVIFKLIEAGADLEYMGRQSALVFFAVSSRNLKLLDTIIEKNLNLDGAVYFALQDSTTTRDDLFHKMISKLLTAGANTTRLHGLNSTAEMYFEDGYYDEEAELIASNDDGILLAAVRGWTDTIKLLLSHGASATCWNTDGETPLLLAYINDHEDATQYLLQEAPSAVTTVSPDGHSPLSLSIARRDRDMIKFFMSSCSFDSGGSHLKDVFFDSMTMRDFETAADILTLDLIPLDCSLADWHTPLSLAAALGHEPIVKLLLNTGKVDINSQHESGKTPLLFAIEKGHEAVAGQLLDTNLVDVCVRDLHGRTPLLVASENGLEIVVRRLLDTKKVDVNAVDNHGQTSLSLALAGEHFGVVELLLGTHELDVNVTDTTGQRPLSMVVKEGSIALSMLLLDIVDHHIIERMGYIEEQKREWILEFLLSSSDIMIEAKSISAEIAPSLAAVRRYARTEELLVKNGTTNDQVSDLYRVVTLSLSAENGHETIFKVLLDKDMANVKFAARDDWTPLMWAAGRGLEGICQLLLSTGKSDVNYQGPYRRTATWWAASNRHIAVVKLLLDKGGSNINLKDINGQTLLMWAVQHGRLDIVKVLLATGKANINEKDKSGWTPLSWAILYGLKK